MGKTRQVTPATVTTAPRRRKHKLTKEQFAAQRQLAQSMIGYDSSSPIWGKTVPEVLDLIETHINNGDLQDALDTLTEYRKRIAQKRIAVVGSI